MTQGELLGVLHTCAHRDFAVYIGIMRPWQLFTLDHFSRLFMQLRMCTVKGMSLSAKQQACFWSVITSVCFMFRVPLLLCSLLHIASLDSVGCPHCPVGLRVEEYRIILLIWILFFDSWTWHLSVSM